MSINTAVKWFDDRRGLTIGVAGMSFSAFSFLAVPVIRRGIGGAFEGTLFVFAAGVGGGAILAAMVLRALPSTIVESDTSAAATDEQA